jgi:hypothetical protein
VRVEEPAGEAVVDLQHALAVRELRRERLGGVERRIGLVDR